MRIARGDLKLRGGLIPWHNHVLHVLLPDRPFSVWLFWSPEWEFISYYVNLETPFARSVAGFDSCDTSSTSACAPIARGTTRTR